MATRQHRPTLENTARVTMDIRKIRKLIEVLEASELDEIEIHEGEESIRLSRRQSTAHHPPQLPTYDGQAEAPPPAPPARPLTEPATGAAEAPDAALLSPMVGTFYRSPAPDAPPFAEVGSLVAPGDVVCIIEAMKMMNRIEADRAGTIMAILVENGQAVEFGQPLLTIA